MVLPLVTGGALAGILKQLGIRLPPSLSRMMGGLGERWGGYGESYSRSGGSYSDLGGGGIQGVMRIAQMFM